MNFVVRLIVTALATALAVWLVPGITLEGDNQLLTLIAVALIFGAINSVIKPLTVAISGCLIILTMGLFLFVVNAAMLLLTSWIAGQFGIGFHVENFVAGLFGSIIISIVSALLGGGLGSGRNAQ